MIEKVMFRNSASVMTQRNLPTFSSRTADPATRLDAP
jgi:hypothetical protein